MITNISPDNAPLITSILRDSPCIGARLEVDRAIARQNPAVPYRFYLSGDRALLGLNTNTALLVGAPQDPEELTLFLSCTGVGRLFSDGWAPPDWERESFFRLLREPGATCPSTEPVGELFPSDSDTEYDPAPSAGDIIQLLEQSSGNILSPEARDRLYADINIRRNHGCADICGFRYQGRLVSTAGAWALTTQEVYIACVETHPTVRRRGLATRLIEGLCNRYPDHSSTLICTQKLLPYYQRMGFSVYDQKGVVATSFT